MLSFLSVIPILGPIFQAAADAWNKHEDITLQKQVDANKTDLGKQQDKNKTDVAVIQTRAEVAIAFKDDLGVKLMRDIMMFPVCTWTCLYFWDLAFPFWELGVKIPSDKIQYLPYAVVAFLFVTAFKGDK